MPNIIHLVTSLDCGGLEKIVIGFGELQNSSSPGSCMICCLDKKGVLAETVRGSNVECLNADRSKFPWDSGAVTRLRDLVTVKAQPAIIHAHNMAAWQYAVLAAMGTSAKVVYTQHGANVHNHGFKNRLRSVLLSWFTPGIVAVSESTADAMVKYQGISRREIHVIRNGVDSAGFNNSQPQMRSARGQLKKELKIPENSFVVGSVGRLDYVKGYDRLIDAFAGLIESQEKGSGVGVQECSAPALPVASSPILLMVGDGPDRGKLEVQAKDRGVGERVIFAGHQDNVAACLGLMDLFVLPSRNEGLPVALLEALAAGVPVAATEAGGSREILDGGIIGAILPENEALWPDIIGREIGMAEVQRVERIRRGRALVEELYSLKIMSAAYEKVYEAVLLK